MQRKEITLIKSLKKAVDLEGLTVGKIVNNSLNQKIYHEIITSQFSRDSPVSGIKSYLKMDKLDVSDNGKVTFIKRMDDDIFIESIFFNNNLSFAILRGNIIFYESKYVIDKNNKEIVYRPHDNEIQQGPFTLTNIIMNCNSLHRFINSQNLKLWFDTIEEVRSFVFTFISMFYGFLSKPSILKNTREADMKVEKELNFGLYKIYPNQRYSSPELVKRYVKYFEEYRPKNFNIRDNAYGIIKVIEPSKSVGSIPLVLYSLNEGNNDIRLEQALATNNNELATTIFNELIHQVSIPVPVRALAPAQAPVRALSPAQAPVRALSPAPAHVPVPLPPTNEALAALKLPEENELWGDIAMKKKYMKYKMKYLALKKLYL